MEYTHISPLELQDNLIKIIGKDYMLVTAGTMQQNNCLTASWGGMGFMWNKPVACIVIRPQRYTKEFIDREEFFTLSFFDESYKKIFAFCGSKSGRDVNKVKECGLTTFETKNGSVAYTEARLILECKKLYAAPFKKEGFICKDLLGNYENGDFHTQYIAEITDCMIK
ncbi:MAG: flavin reductase [Bacteroidales bacterium]|nr:flavin reductase [Bacteroidales bacterium]